MVSSDVDEIVDDAGRIGVFEGLKYRAKIWFADMWSWGAKVGAPANAVSGVRWARLGADTGRSG